MKNSNRKSIGQILKTQTTVLDQNQMNDLRGGDDGDGIGVTDLLDG